MKKLTIVAAAVAASLLPMGASAQGGVGVGVRVGSVGIGGELALDLTDRIVARGGIGFLPFEPETTVDELEVSLEFPDWYNVGLDFYLNGAFRIGGGVAFKSKDPRAIGNFTTDQDIGGTTYTPSEIGTLIGTIDSRDRVPYVLIGFGKHTSRGVGLFIDLGLGFLGDPDVTLDADGSLSGDPTFESNLDQEARDFEDDLGGYLRFWPILNLGLRIGVG